MLFHNIYRIENVFPSIGPRLTKPVSKFSYIHTKKTWSQPDARSTYLGSRIALLVETSNAESPTPMNIYITLQGIEVCTNSQCGLYINIPRGVPVALFLTNSLNLRDSGTSKPKRSVTPFYMYVPCPLPTQGAFSKGNDGTNIHIFNKDRQKICKKKSR